MNIYLAPSEEVFKNSDNYTPFAPSEWNELNELPKEAHKLIEWATKNNCVYTYNSFMLAFNSKDTETYHGAYLMFIPDNKFKL